MTSRALAFVNADLGASVPETLRVQGERIVGIGGPVREGDVVVDLEGDRLLPGLINAHDHLQLNSFATPDYGRHYRNAGEWISDLNERADLAYVFDICKRTPRDERLLHGGVKNILSGVTTVAHHDPLYSSLSSVTFPTRVVQSYGWSHSLGIEGEERVQGSYRSTRPELPWIIHAAEGIDEMAGREFDWLDALGCIGSNTVLVHGVALDGTRRARLVQAGAGLIWCPTSNLTLFGSTAEVAELVARGRVALGSDSRLTGSFDFLDELRIAAQVSNLDEAALESLVTAAAARLLGLGDRGALRAGALADLLVLPARGSLTSVRRADLRMVMLGGRMSYGDRAYARLLLPEERRVEILLAGRLKVVDCDLARLLSTPGSLETEVEVLDPVESAA
jgi:cytosine/adenosine deaminase-related metal-dependent hydrolase